MFKYYIVLSILATFGAVYNSYVSHTQFYPTILYLTTNKINRTILFNFALMMVSRFLIFLIQLTFGEIRELEKTSVIEKTKRKIIEIAYLFYFMNDGLDWQFLYLMMGLIALSVLHWIAVKRAQYLIAESTIRFAPHLKLIMCFIVLFYIDIKVFIQFYKTSLYFLSADVYEFQDVLFGFEFLLLPIKLTLPFIKYTVNIFEILTYSQFGWKQTIFSFLDVIFSLIKVSIQICLIRYAFQTQGFILYLLVDAFENIFGLFRQIKVFFNQIRLVRLIDKIQDVDTIDKNHNTCLICLNDLDQGKRLSCGHIFHKSCIKTWIQENPNQFCPKCKKPIQFDETQTFVDKDQLKQQSQIYFSELLEIQNTISVLQLVHKIRDMQGIPQNQDGIGSVQFGLPTEAIYNPSIENEIRRLQINQMNAVLLGFEHGKIEPSQFQL